MYIFKISKIDLIGSPPIIPINVMLTYSNLLILFNVFNIAIH